MQRVRIGLTGLGFVFVAVLLAAALTGQAGDEAPVSSNGIAPLQQNKQAAPQEPLAELGVTPGNADANGHSAVNQAQPQNP
jgi:hypothetical protein